MTFYIDRHCFLNYEECQIKMYGSTLEIWQKGETEPTVIDCKDWFVAMMIQFSLKNCRKAGARLLRVNAQTGEVTKLSSEPVSLAKKRKKNAIVTPK